MLGRRNVAEYLDLALPISRMFSPQLATAAAAESAAVTAAAVVTAAGMAPLPLSPLPTSPSPSPAAEIGPIGPGCSVAVIMEKEEKKVMNVTVNSNCKNGDGDKEAGDGSAEGTAPATAANNLGIDPQMLEQHHFRRPHFWEIHNNKKGMRNTFQGDVYNFLERPTGWKCFLYHFSV